MIVNYSESKYLKREFGRILFTCLVIAAMYYFINDGNIPEDSQFIFYFFACYILIRIVFLSYFRTKLRGKAFEITDEGIQSITHDTFLRWSEIKKIYMPKNGLLSKDRYFMIEPSIHRIPRRNNSTRMTLIFPSRNLYFRGYFEEDREIIKATIEHCSPEVVAKSIFGH